MDSEAIEIREDIRQVSGIRDLVRVVHTFTGHRKNRAGKMKAVTVEIREEMPGASYRYSVKATDEDGREATGQGGDTVQTALFTTHWDNLDLALIG